MRWPKIKINISFLLLLVVFLVNKRLFDLLLIFLVIVVHEIGHIIMIKFKKGTIKKISIGAFGANMTIDCKDSQLVNFGRHPWKCNIDMPLL